MSSTTGYQNLKDLEADADFTIVDANVLYNGQVAFEDNVVFTANGTKIGVFGLDTPETATKAHPAKIQGVTFLAGDKMFDCAQDQVDALEAEGCEYIICLGHLGIDAESTGNRSIDLLEKVEGIDVFIDGHSHSTLEDVKAAAGGTGKVGDTPGDLYRHQAGERGRGHHRCRRHHHHRHYPRCRPDRHGR